MTRKQSPRQDDFTSRPGGHHAEYLTPGDPDYGDISEPRRPSSHHDGLPERAQDRWQKMSDEVADWLQDERAGDAVTHKRPTGQRHDQVPRSDAQIRQEVCNRLAEADGLGAANIEVGVRSGAVTLSGQVFSQQDRHHAEELTRTVTGVTLVHNDLGQRLSGQDPGT